MNNIIDTFQEVYKNLDKLHEFADTYDFDHDEINEIAKQIDYIMKYYGVRKLKMDIPPLKKDEIVQIDESEAGVFLHSLERHGLGWVDIFSVHTKLPFDEWFYE